jgi:hypothetical protein
VFLALDIETTFAVKQWIDSAGIGDGYLLRGITGNELNLAMDPGQISCLFKSIAVKTELDPKEISGHSTRIGAAQDLLDGGVSIGQIMAKVGWSKVDAVMRYVGVGELSALQSKSNYCWYSSTATDRNNYALSKNVFFKYFYLFFDF